MAFLRKLTARDHSKLSGAETVLPTYTRAHFMSEEGVTFKEAKLVGIHPVTAKATKADILEATQKAKAYSKARGVHKKRLTVSLSIQEGFITRDERGLYTRTRTHKIYSWYQDEIEPDIFVIMAKVECDSVAVKDEYSCMVLKSPEAVGILHALTSMIQIVYNKDHPMIRAMEPLSPSTQGKPSPSVQRRPTAGADTFPQPQQSVSASALSSPASAKPFAPLSPSMSAPSISQSSATAQPPGFIAPSLTGKSNDHWSFQEENFDAKWQCSACTFLNQGLLIQCEACGQFKPSVVQQQHQQVQTPVKQTGYMNASAVRSPPGSSFASAADNSPFDPRKRTPNKGEVDEFADLASRRNESNSVYQNVVGVDAQQRQWQQQQQQQAGSQRPFEASFGSNPISEPDYVNITASAASASRGPAPSQSAPFSPTASSAFPPVNSAVPPTSSAFPVSSWSAQPANSQPVIVEPDYQNIPTKINWNAKSGGDTTQHPQPTSSQPTSSQPTSSQPAPSQPAPSNPQPQGIIVESDYVNIPVRSPSGSRKQAPVVAVVSATQAPAPHVTSFAPNFGSVQAAPSPQSKPTPQFQPQPTTKSVLSVELPCSLSHRELFIFLQEQQSI
eukprot:m.125618 g.125618  ORF g.125618 m.125618 type:complete len:615 (-) comp52217_c0_seq2:144-1988(-)